MATAAAATSQQKASFSIGDQNSAHNKYLRSHETERNFRHFSFHKENQLIAIEANSKWKQLNTFIDWTIWIELRQKFTKPKTQRIDIIFGGTDIIVLAEVIDTFMIPLSGQTKLMKICDLFHLYIPFAVDGFAVREMQARKKTHTEQIPWPRESNGQEYVSVLCCCFRSCFFLLCCCVFFLCLSHVISLCKCVNKSDRRWKKENETRPDDIIYGQQIIH